jgi:hypothetical protein
MSHGKRGEREHLDFIRREFQQNGIHQWRTRRAHNTHTRIEFVHGGRSYHLTISASEARGAGTLGVTPGRARLPTAGQRRED